MSPKSLARFEAKSVAWINIIVVLFVLPLLVLYVYQVLRGVAIENVLLFLSVDPRGQECAEILVKLAIFLIFWVPLSILLGYAASRMNHSLLKICSICQVLLLFVVALHLLVRPPTSLIIVAAYMITFIYFLITLWICENLIREIKEGQSPNFLRMHVEAEVPSPLIMLNNNNNNNDNSFDLNSLAFANTIEDDNSNNDNLSIQMKKVLIPST